MSQRICSILDCGTPARARGVCHRHYQNKQGLGRYEAKKDLPLIARLLDTGWDETSRGCWEWRGTRSEDGYGLIHIKKLATSNLRVHRLMWEMHNGPIPDGLVVRHRCDNPPCVNPDHLEVGTKKDNAADMVQRLPHVSYRSNWWDGMCKNGLHDITLPGALVARMLDSGNTGMRCRECYEVTQERVRVNEAERHRQQRRL